MDLDSFITKYNGQSIPNNHGKYVGECVSLAARYAQEVQGVPDGDSTLYCQTTGGARDLYEHPTSLELQYYDLIPYGQPRLKGDLVIWGANLGKYGDVAVADNVGTVIFGQLGTPVFIPANIRSESRSPLGYLRRKGAEMFTPAEVNQLIQATMNFPATDTQKAVYSTLPIAEVLQKVLESKENVQLRTDAQAYVNGQVKPIDVIINGEPFGPKGV